MDHGTPATWLPGAVDRRKGEVVLGATVLVVAQAVVRAVVLAHSSFANDDFMYVSRAAEQGFGWRYLTDLYYGQFMPGVFAVVGVLPPYDWFLASLTTLVLQVCAAVALFRLLRLMFGTRPAILVPFAVYLFSPLTLPMVAWWAAALQGLPLQIAMIMALTAHLRYLSDRRTRHLVATVGWLVFGLLFFVKAILIPPLLFAVTWLLRSGERPLTAGFAEAGRRYARTWAAQAAVLGGFAVVYLSRVGTSFVRPRTPTLPEVGRLAAGLLGRTFVTEAAGGPFRWFMLGPNDALSAPAWIVTVAGWLVLVAVVACSVRWRRRAARAWTLLFCYLLADVVIVLAGRVGPIDVATRVSRYIADAAPILAIVLAAAFLPQRDEENVYREAGVPGSWRLGRWGLGAARLSVGRFSVGRFSVARWAGAGLAVVVAAGCAVSTAGLTGDLRAGPVRSYLDHVRQGLRIAPDTQDIYPSLVPDVLAGADFGDDRLTSRVLSPLARPALADRMRHPEPTAVPWIFDDRGYLRRMGIYGAITGPGQGKQCFAAAPASSGSPATITIPITVRADPAGVGSLSYLTPEDTHIRVADQDLLLPKGLGQIYFPLHDPADAIQVVIISGGTGFCITGAAAGAGVPAAS
jgi:hypothetical protein